MTVEPFQKKTKTSSMLTITANPEHYHQTFISIAVNVLMVVLLVPAHQALSAIGSMTSDTAKGDELWNCFKMATSSILFDALSVEIYGRVPRASYNDEWQLLTKKGENPKYTDYGGKTTDVENS